MVIAHLPRQIVLRPAHAVLFPFFIVECVRYIYLKKRGSKDISGVTIYAAYGYFRYIDLLNAVLPNENISLSVWEPYGCWNVDGHVFDSILLELSGGLRVALPAFAMFLYMRCNGFRHLLSGYEIEKPDIADIKKAVACSQARVVGLIYNNRCIL